MASVDLSIIVVNWNTRDFLKRCLECLAAACNGLIYEIWVVDNASTDGSIDLLQEYYPEVKLICNRENLGFAKANNQACAKAQGRYLLLLNPDTEPMPKSFYGLVKYADAHPEVGVLGPSLLNSDGSLQRSCWRRYPGLGMALVNALYLWKLSWFPLNWVSEYQPWELCVPLEVDHLLGACLLIRRSAWELVGMLDESYFLGSEETDWCYRAKHLGWKIVYHPEFQVIHHGQKSSWQQPAQALPRLYAGYQHFYSKRHNSRLGLILLLVIFMLECILRIGLWSFRWFKLRDLDKKQNARRMIDGYVKTTRYLIDELCHFLSAFTSSR